MNTYILLLFIQDSNVNNINSGLGPASVTHSSQGPTISHEITAFSEQSAVDTLVVSDTMPSYDMNPYTDDTLYGFLQRPRLVTSSTWDDTYASGSRIVVVDPYFELITSTPIKHKLENFNYFKAGVRIGVRVNGTPFHYGKLLVVWKPMCGSTRQSQQEMRDNIYSSSGYPHIIISPTENEVNEMVLPFAYDAAYMDLSADEVRSPGQLFIYVLNPLALDSSVPPVSISVFANFEDVALAGQSGIVNLPLHTRQTIYDDPNPFNPVATSFVAQGDVQREAIDKSTKGLISGPLKATSAIAGSLTTIPSIGVWASSVSLVASALGSLFEKFGYCKPNTLETTAPRILKVGDFSHGEGVETAPTTQVIPGQSITDLAHHLGGKPNEMDLLNIVSTPCLRGIFTWQGNDAPDSTLFTCFVNPADTFTVQQGGSIRVLPTLLSWTCKTFGFWRGSLRYDIQITCSNFHSGRMRVLFQPRNAGVLTDFDHQNCINRIIDIQNETEFSFTVPYIADVPWHSLNLNSIEEQIGFLQFSVVNELTHTTEPIPEVHINVWVSAGPDFQLAMPARKNARSAGPLPETGPLGTMDEVFEAQGLTSYEMKMRDHPPLMEGATGSVENNICQTDTVTHLKQMMHRPAYCRTIVLDSDDATVCEVINLRYVYDPNLTTRTDFTDWFANIFVFGRGSYNIRCVPQWNIATSPMMLWIQQNYGLMYGFQYSSQNIELRVQGTGQQLAASSYNPVAEANIPYYSNRFAVVNAGRTIPRAYASSAIIQIEPNGYGQGDVNIDFWRSVGDDFNYHYLIGPPSYYVDAP
jgi:hypothetical protein